MNDSKIIIINSDGIITKEPNSEEFHSLLLTKYIKNNYPDLNITDNCSPNYLAIKLRELGNLVFLNITHYINDKPSSYGKDGIIVAPDLMTDKINESLKEISPELETYDSIQIWHNFTDTYECQTMYSNNKNQIPGLINYFIDENMKGKTRLK